MDSMIMSTHHSLLSVDPRMDVLLSHLAKANLVRVPRPPKSCPTDPLAHALLPPFPTLHWMLPYHPIHRPPYPPLQSVCYSPPMLVFVIVMEVVHLVMPWEGWTEKVDAGKHPIYRHLVERQRVEPERKNKKKHT